MSQEAQGEAEARKCWEEYLKIMDHVQKLAAAAGGASSVDAYNDCTMAIIEASSNAGYCAERLEALGYDVLFDALPLVVGGAALRFSLVRKSDGVVIDSRSLPLRAAGLSAAEEAALASLLQSLAMLSGARPRLPPLRR